VSKRLVDAVSLPSPPYKGGVVVFKVPLASNAEVLSIEAGRMFVLRPVDMLAEDVVFKIVEGGVVFDAFGATYVGTFWVRDPVGQHTPFHLFRFA
jgi:hypothetical protein